MLFYVVVVVVVVVIWLLCLCAFNKRATLVILGIDIVLFKFKFFRRLY